MEYLQKIAKIDFSKILDTVADDKKAVAEALIDEIRFMQQTLNTLKDKIKENGTEELFQNGRQEINHEAPALNSYIKLVARYSSLYKQLCNLVKRQADDVSELDTFIKEE
ncbi:MAG: hypothetical protein IJQ57_11980 [Synergistaceae bacterium]|nr:hypothetical protein [Synergistaceae bacterium]MBR0254058.1 hypothetical protein [Synergistaceae bacterium]